MASKNIKVTFISLEEAAKLLGIDNKATIDNWLKSGKIPWSFFKCGNWFFEKGTILKLKKRMDHIKELNESKSHDIESVLEELEELEPPLL